MCLIVWAESARPEPKYLMNAVKQHPHGVGVAWKEEGRLRFKKDFTHDEMLEFAATMPLGYIMHFRKASVGGLDANLIHPFIVSKTSPIMSEGDATALLFHNGHWPNWNNVILNHLTRHNILPKGVWSDTRAIAYLTAFHGVELLKMLPGKFIVATRKRISIWGAQ